ncbi:hypothetical protein M422DRAFT_260539, partial [Sphaerobolus stellatus SS14]
MLLAQKPPQAINFRHRRHPASMSGIVVAHPTNTPGVFALAKPLRTPQRGHPRSQSPRCSPRNRVPRPPVERPSRHFPTPPRGRPEQQPSPEATVESKSTDSPSPVRITPRRRKQSPADSPSPETPAPVPASAKPLLPSAPIAVPDHRRASTPPR